MKTSIILAAASTAALFATCALAQDPPRGCPAGQAWAAVRVSKIIGTRAGFDQAVKDHIKWYRDHGYTANTITVGPVMETADKGMTFTPSKDTVLSLHLNDPGVPPSKYDAAWKAYVAEYQANSQIISQTFGCVTK